MLDYTIDNNPGMRLQLQGEVIFLDADMSLGPGAVSS